MQRRGDGKPRGPTCSIKHALVQEVAYETLLKSERQRHHLAIAEAMEAAADPVAYVAEMLAHHFADAGPSPTGGPLRHLRRPGCARSSSWSEPGGRGPPAEAASTCCRPCLPFRGQRDQLELTVLVAPGCAR